LIFDYFEYLISFKTKTCSIIGQVFSLMKFFSIQFIYICVLCILFGCKSVRENLDKQYDRVEKIYSETYAQSKNKEVQELTWEDAKEMMLENNLELQRAYDSLERARESQAQIYWDLVLSLRFSTNLSKACTNNFVT